MSRPPVIPAEKKIRIVLSVLQGEVSIAEAARREKVSEQAIGNWKRQFLEGGKAGIEAGKSKPTSREPRNAAPPHCRSPARPGTRTWPPSASTPASKTPGKKTPPPNSPSEEVGRLGLESSPGPAGGPPGHSPASLSSAELRTSGTAQSRSSGLAVLTSRSRR